MCRGCADKLADSFLYSIEISFLLLDEKDHIYFIKTQTFGKFKQTEFIILVRTLVLEFFWSSGPFLKFSHELYATAKLTEFYPASNKAQSHEILNPYYCSKHFIWAPYSQAILASRNTLFWNDKMFATEGTV